MTDYLEVSSVFFFFNDTATTEIYTLSLHDALPISARPAGGALTSQPSGRPAPEARLLVVDDEPNIRELLSRSEEHTSELQSRQYLVCRLLLEKKKQSTFLLTPSTSTTPPPPFHNST